MKKTSTFLFCIAAVAFIVQAFFIFTNTFYAGKDYTEAYTIHTQISSLSSTEEIAEYLTENEFSYTMSNTSLAIDDYDITYTITENKFVPCTELIELSRLDKKDDKDLVVEAHSINGKYTERIQLEKVFIEYYKINNNYYIKATGTFKFFTIFFGVAGVIATLAAIETIPISKKD